MEACNSQLWLMKVPNFLLEHWQSRDDKPTELGIVSESVDSTGKKALSLRLTESGNYPTEWPREYQLSLDAPPCPMHVFSRARDAQGASKGPVQLDGVVVKKGELKPPLNQEFKALMKTRTEKAAVRSELKTMDQKNVPGYQPRLTVRDKRDREAEREARETKKAAKQIEPIKPGELRSLVFDRFTDQRFWNKKELEAATGQKSADIKKVLDLIAERVAVGPHKGEYQLKPEYRDGGDA